MKNIHLIKTDKLSRLYEFGGQFILTHELTDAFRNYHIYITSDEEIKEGDWYITSDNKVLKCTHLYMSLVYSLNDYGRNRNSCQKIILTTDPELIKDGVQAIDDTFLEWFVNNPSCENVEVERDSRDVGNHLGGIATEYGDYEIIIPQEEPKQETLTYTEAAKKEERIFNSTMMFKQETLEEAGIAYAKTISEVATRPSHMIGFYSGAKWQQERMYNEEECYKTLHNLMTDIKLQGLVINDDIDLKKWFEQFKKK
jgi:hypothetical protein